MTTREASTSEAMPLERLEAEITELAGHLAAGECRWLQLIAEYDRRAGHETWGCRTIAHWLSWHCGLDVRSAREKVRVAHALEELPLVAEEFAGGRLSYSKVRAITRVATPATEEQLVMLAQHATAAQVERIVRTYRGMRSVEEETEAANERYAEQYLHVEYDLTAPASSAAECHRRSQRGCFVLSTSRATTCPPTSAAKAVPRDRLDPGRRSTSTRSRSWRSRSWPASPRLGTVASGTRSGSASTPAC